ncbi:copia protein [Tanacetum coccineum]
MATTSKGNFAAGQPRVVKCYNCQGEGHMARQLGQILDKEQLVFLADPGISEASVALQTIPKNLVFQTKDLDAYDSDCDDLSSAKAVLMENLSSCDPEVLFKVPYSDSYLNDMINQDVQEMQYSEQTHINDFQDNEIHSDSNTILYSQYLQESQDAVIQDTNSSAPNDLLVLSLVEQMTDHVAHLDKENKINKMINESLTADLERYKERLNKIKEDFGKRFVTKKELSAEQAFWLKHSSFSETPVTSHTPIRIEAPSELPKVSLVNESLKKLKYQLANFDNVVKKRTTSDAIIAGAWGFEHTKACFVTEIILFLKVLKDTFNAFDKTLLAEITEVQTSFNQTEAVVDQCSVDKNAFEIQIKQLSINNDQLLKQIMSQEIVHHCKRILLVVPTFQQGEDPIESINKAMAFLSVVASWFPPSNNQLRTSSNPINQATIQDGRVIVQKVQGRQTQSYAGIGNRGMTTTLKGNFAAGQPRILDEEQLVFLADPDCDDLSSAKAVLMENLLSCDPEVLFKDTNSSAPNDLLVLSLVDQMTDHVAHLDKENKTNKMINESLTADLERYKERVTIFKQRLNVDLNKYEKLIDSQMDDLIRDRNAKLADFQQKIDTLKRTLSNNVKEKESLSKTLTMYRSTQAMHMLTKPQVFYDDTHKQALGYQNLFHLKKAQRIQPTLYDVSVIAKEHAMIFVIDDAETLILEEDSRSKMLDKQNDPISIEKKIKISLIDYSKLNKIKEDFGKRFVTQKELSAEQAFWLKHYSFSETPVTLHTPVRFEAPSKLPSVLGF